MVFEDDVLYFEQQENYAVKRPIKHGFFNLNDGKETIQSVASDIEKLIDYIMTKKLGIKRSEFANYSVILVTPDVFQRQQIKALIDMFLVSMCFNAIYLHQESALALFGACLNHACVVDIGYQKINVSCVDEGVIVPNTVVRKNFGGDDIDNLLYRLLTRKHSALFKKKGYRVSSVTVLDSPHPRAR